MFIAIIFGIFCCKPKFLAALQKSSNFIFALCKIIAVICEEVKEKSLYIACKFAVVITSNSDKPTKWLHTSIDNCAYNIIFDYIS